MRKMHRSIIHKSLTKRVDCIFIMPGIMKRGWGGLLLLITLLMGFMIRRGGTGILMLRGIRLGMGIRVEMSNFLKYPSTERLGNNIYKPAAVKNTKTAMLEAKDKVKVYHN